MTGRELVDLPLNGRNFTQLGLLQTGVAPLTAGVATAGGSAAPGTGLRRQRHAARAEHLPGRRRAEHEPHGRRLRAEAAGRRDRRVPHPHAERAARIRRHRRRHDQRRHARRAATSFHGSALRVRAQRRVRRAQLLLARRSSRSSSTSSARTLGGPLQTRSRVLLRLLRGLPQRAGRRRPRATVPTAQERQGDFSGMGTPLLNFAAGGVPFPGNQIPAAAINPVARNVRGPVSARQRLAVDLSRDAGRQQRLDQAGGRVDFNASPNDQIFAPLLVLGRPQHQPDLGARHRRAGLSRRATTSRRTRPLVSSTRIFSPSLTNSLRGTYLRHKFFFDQRLNQHAAERARLRLRARRTRSARGRRSSTSAATRRSAARSPARATRRRRTFEMQDSAVVDARRAPGQGRRRVPAHRHRHVPGDRAERVLRVRRHVPDQQRRRQPAARRAGHLLSGARRLQPRRARLERRRLRAGRVAGRHRADGELRAALRAHQPVHRDRGSAERASSRACSRRCGPTRRAGLVFPGDPGVGQGIAQSANAFMPRVGRRLGSDRRRQLVGARELRPLLRPVPERRRHGVAGGDQRDAVRRSSTSSAAPA